MSTKAEKAMEFYDKGYNCAQSVVCAFCEEGNISEEDAFRLSEGFGSGMAVKEMCGAVSGMAMVIGLVNSVGNLEKGAPTKPTTYAAVKEYTEKFQNKNGSYLCRELKGIGTGNPLCSCKACVKDAVELVEEYLKERQN